MRAVPARAFAVMIPLLFSTLPAYAGELFTPALPANGAQFQECRIVNVSGSPKTVTTEAFNSTGASSSGPYTQTLAPGEAGGFSLSGIYASMYCKFTVPGKTDNYRGSIDVLDPTTTPTQIVVALPAT
jgi:hypothetical protein